MFAAWLLSIVVSAIGWLVYRLLLRNSASSIQKKLFLIALVIVSIASPFYYANVEATTQENEELIYVEEIFTTYCPKEEVLESCYSLAISDEDFCHCEEIEKSNIVLYSNNSFYDYLAIPISKSWPLFFSFAVGLMIILLIQYLYLIYLIRTSTKSQLRYGDEQLTILHTRNKSLVASFQLFNKYIIWQKELSDLTENELKAVLMHEITHIRQRDTLLKAFLWFIQLYWLINPIFYIVKKELLRLSEFIADEVAVKKMGDPIGYARLLLKMKCASQASPPAFSSAFGQVFLKERIQHILQGPQRRTFGRYLIVGLSLMLSLHFCLPAAENCILVQLERYKVYQTLSSKHNESGKDTFCKKCLLEQWGEND